MRRRRSAPGGEIAAEARFPADADGLAGLVRRLGTDVIACVEMMSGAHWVRDQLAAAGWRVEVADARKPHALSPCPEPHLEPLGMPQGSPPPTPTL